MTFNGRLTFVVLWFASLALVGAIVSAQTRHEPAAVISGSDIGFRPEGWDGNARTGTWVVRINGEWVEAHDLVKNVHATR